MAIDAKVSFIGMMEKELAGVLTVEQMEKLRKTTVGLLDQFEMSEIRQDDLQEDDLLDCYLSAMKVQCRSPKTIARYEYIIRKMMDSVKVPTRRITVYHLRNYLAAEKERGVNDSTLEGLRQVFSAYFNWLQRESLIERNPTANLGPIRVPKKQKKIYSEVDLEKLSRECETPRDRALIAFLASTGCRVSEVTGLNRDQVDLERLQCVVHGKGNKERTVYLDEVAGMLLREYLEGREDCNPALFCSRRESRLATNSVRVILNKVAERAGVEHVHPHKFRRTLATNLARRGMPVQTVAKILGHDQIDTTMEYVVLNDADVKNEYRRYA